MSILCAVSGKVSPDNVVTVGHDLATTYDTELAVLNVMTRDRFETLADERVEFYMDDGAAEAKQTARTVTRETITEPHNFDPRGRVGDPTEEIIEEAARMDATYIVIGGRKRTPVGKAVFGSTTQSVLLNAEQPVVTVMSEE